MTHGLLNLIPNAVGQGQTTISYAEVASPAPAAFTDPLFVVEPDWTIDFPHAIPTWPACHGVTLPLVGDAVLLVHDSRGNRRCVWWDGQMTFSTQTSRTYYLTTVASDVASHQLISAGPFSPKTTLSFSNLANGQSLLDYMTSTGVPGTAYLPAGQFEFHIHALQYTGNEVIRMYAEFWEYDPNTATHVAMIGASTPTRPLTTTEIEYRLFFSTQNVYTFVSSASRIAVHVRVLVGGTGGGTVRYFVGGTSDSHAVIPANLDTSVVDLSAVGVTYTLVAPPSGDTTGATDAAAISTAVASLPSGHGVLQFQHGVYYDNTQRDFSSSIAVTMRGVGGRSAGATPGTIIEYTGTASSYVKAGDSSGFAIEDLMLLYNNAGFSGTLIDFTSVGAAPYGAIRRCYLGSSGGIHTAAAIVNTSGCQDMTIEDSAISDGTYGVIGRSTVGLTATAITFNNVHFKNNVTAHVKNAGEAWTFDEGCAFEALVGGGAGAYKCDFAGGVLTFDGCWFGDITTGGTTQISFTGKGLTVRGGDMGNNALGGGTGIVVNSGSSNVDIRGVSFSFMGVAIDLTASGVTDVDVGPNDYVAGTVTTPIAGGASISKSRRRSWAGLLTPDFLGKPEQITLTASRCYFGRFVPSEDMTASKIAFIVNTVSGSNDNCDVGIFDGTGTRLASSGSTAGLLNAGGRHTPSLSASVNLRAGSVYYAAFACGPIGTSAAIVVGFAWNEISTPTIMGTAVPDVACGVVNAFPLGAGPVVLLNTSPSALLLGVLQ